MAVSPFLSTTWASAVMRVPTPLPYICCASSASARSCRGGTDTPNASSAIPTAVGPQLASANGVPSSWLRYGAKTWKISMAVSAG